MVPSHWAITFWRPLLAQWNPGNPIIDGEKTCKFVQSLSMMLFLFRPKILLCCGWFGCNLFRSTCASAGFAVAESNILSQDLQLVEDLLKAIFDSAVTYEKHWKASFLKGGYRCMSCWSKDWSNFIHDCCLLEIHNRVFAMRLICGNSTCVQRSMLH